MALRIHHLYTKFIILNAKLGVFACVSGEGAPDGQAGEYVYYKVNVDRITLGGSTIQSNAQIMTDTGAVGIYPPNDQILKALHKAAPVAADCSNKDSLPDLRLTVGTCYPHRSCIW